VVVINNLIYVCTYVCICILIYSMCSFVVMQENLNMETLQKQFQIVKSETNTSHVMEYGAMVSNDYSSLLITFNVHVS